MFEYGERYGNVLEWVWFGVKRGEEAKMELGNGISKVTLLTKEKQTERAGNGIHSFYFKNTFKAWKIEWVI